MIAWNDDYDDILKCSTKKSACLEISHISRISFYRHQYQSANKADTGYQIAN